MGRAVTRARVERTAGATLQREIRDRPALELVSFEVGRRPDGPSAVRATLHADGRVPAALSSELASRLSGALRQPVDLELVIVPVQRQSAD